MNEPRILQLGMEGEDVRALQATLAAEGYSHYFGYKPDGVFGPGTQYAVKRFQKDHGIPPDGVVGFKTMAALAKAKERLSMVERPQPEPLNPLFPSIFTLDFSKQPSFEDLVKDIPKPLIVLDPGHGYYIHDKTNALVHDQGARKRKGNVVVAEENINLTFALSLRTELEKRGFEVEMTRDEATDVLPSRFKSRADVALDRKIMHLSIHADSTAPSKKGMDMYYSKAWDTDAPSAVFARALGGGFAKTHGTTILAPAYLGDIPSALVELGNMNNKRDFAHITSATGQAILVELLADRIEAYYEAQRTQHAEVDAAKNAPPATAPKRPAKPATQRH